MTSIKVDLRSVMGSRGDGTVSAHAEPDRPSAGGGWLSENVDHVKIVDGIAVLPNVEPGPTRLYIAAGSYVRDWLVVVPEGDGEIPIEDLIGLDYEWDPPTVGKAQQAQRGAEAAEAGAVAARTGAETAASTATSAATTATTARDQAVVSATSAAASEGTAAGSAAEAGDHRTGAAAAASAAASSENTAASAAATATTASSEAATAAATATSMAEGFGLSATATTGEAGSQAQVTITRDGSAPTYTASFTVPRGTQGTPGEVSQSQLDAGLAVKADLIGGKVPQSQIPAAALTDYLGEVGSEAAMLGLVGERGDWCTRTDTGTDWQAIAEPTSVLSSWREHTYPQSPVQSVAGRTGAVTLSTDDVGGLTVALGGKSPKGHTHTAEEVGAVTAPAGGLTVWRGTEAAYTAIGTKDANTLYLRTP